MVTCRRGSWLPVSIQHALLQHFVAGTPARSAALLVGVNRHTATLFFHKLRETIFDHLAAEVPELVGGEVELDESYFGGQRKDKRGRGAGGKVPVFGLLKRGGKVHTVVIPAAAASTLMPIVRQRIRPDSVVYTDSFAAYNVLDAEGFKHLRINHQKSFVDRRNHINGIENFWSQAKRHLRRYNGIPKAHFHLYLKECEWRFNYRPQPRLVSTLSAWFGLCYEGQENVG